MADPVKVWMARPGHRDTTPGLLTLDERAVGFTGEEVAIRIPAAAIKKVRRARGSPVVTVTWDEEGDRREASFYFVEPAPIGRSREPVWIPGRRANRAASLMHLRAANKELKPLVAEWTEGIRRMAAGGGQRS